MKPEIEPTVITENDDFDDEGDDGTMTDISRLLEGSTLTRANFLFGRTLGEGSYARVMHAKLKSENSPSFATKIMEKSFIKKEKKVLWYLSANKHQCITISSIFQIKYVAREIEILSAMSHPLVIR